MLNFFKQCLLLSWGTTHDFMFQCLSLSWLRFPQSIQISVTFIYGLSVITKKNCLRQDKISLYELLSIFVRSWYIMSYVRISKLSLPFTKTIIWLPVECNLQMTYLKKLTKYSCQRSWEHNCLRGFIHFIIAIMNWTVLHLGIDDFWCGTKRTEEINERCVEIKKEEKCEYIFLIGKT